MAADDADGDTTVGTRAEEVYFTRHMKNQYGCFEPPDRSGKAAWPHPVLANGRLYLRDQDVLLCSDVKEH